MTPSTSNTVDEAFEVETESKTVRCFRIAKTSSDLTRQPAIVFTHGAGGDLSSEGIANFTHGFATQAPVVCFRGNMNLKSRIKGFRSVCENLHSFEVLGGRSMGARAAVMTANEETTHLALVSYPLHTGQQTRDQILLDLPKSLKVIFVIGEKDSMCDLKRLEQVRERMQCQTWLVKVLGADHGMNVKPKAGTQAVGILTGEVVAQWLAKHNEEAHEGRIHWDAEKEEAVWSGWSQDIPSNVASDGERERQVASEDTESTSPAVGKKRNATKERTGPESKRRRSRR